MRIMRIYNNKIISFMKELNYYKIKYYLINNYYIIKIIIMIIIIITIK